MYVIVRARVADDSFKRQSLVGRLVDVLLRIIGLYGDHRGSFTTAVGILQDQKFHQEINGGHCTYGSCG